MPPGHDQSSTRPGSQGGPHGRVLGGAQFTNRPGPNNNSGANTQSSPAPPMQPQLGRTAAGPGQPMPAQPSHMTHHSKTAQVGQVQNLAGYGASATEKKIPRPRSTNAKPAAAKKKAPENSAAPLSAPRSLQGAAENNSADLGTSTMGYRQLKVEDALAYLEDVKREFHNQPQVYNQFLDIMKEFKAQTIDTTEVIRRVSHLFRGHPKLILGFNTFLPPGYKIEVRDDPVTGVTTAGFSGPGGYSPLTNNGPPPPPPPPPPTESVVGPGNDVTGFATAQGTVGVPVGSYDSTGTPGVPKAFDYGSTTFAPAANSSHPRGTGGPMALMGSSYGLPHGQKPPHAGRVEFHQAINYVNKIKVRFAEQDSVYKQFLEILNTYQVEKKTIKDVYEEVAVLFKDHRDLLDEFANFLPDPSLQPKDHTPRAPPKPTKPRTTPAPKAVPKKINTAGPIAAPAPSVPSKKEKAAPSTATVNRAPNVEESSPPETSPSEDMRVLEFLKQALTDHPTVYQEFLKCLAVYSREVWTKVDLLALVQELLENVDSQLVRKFEEFLNDPQLGVPNETRIDDIVTSSAASSSSGLSAVGFDLADPLKAASKNIQWLNKPISEIAAESPVSCTESYKKLPPDFLMPTCSGRSELERKTLNDVWVSVPMGSEDYTTKLRKNQYEDNLFRCEDDRYELDMVIETNASTIQKLEPIGATIAKLTYEDKRKYALAEGALGAVHFRAIERIYGDHGAEVVDQVKLNPSVAVPVVLTRLKQKDEQWRKARLEMNKIWREVCEKNFYKALDHRSYVFKQVDKRELSHKSLRDDIHDPVASAAAKEQALSSARGYVSGAGVTADQQTVVSGAAIGLPNTLELTLGGKRGHEDAFAILSYALRLELHDAKEAKLILRRFKSLLDPFFGLNLELDMDKDSMAIDDDEDSSPEIGKLKPLNAQETKSGSPSSTTMYGDEALYMLFRLEHVLSERLRLVRRMGKAQVDKEAELKNRAELSTANGPLLCNHPSSITQSQTLLDADETVLSNVTFQDVDSVYNEYVHYLERLLSASLESGKYEDKCRSLLGTGSYVLFTMDKVVSRMVKQVQLIFASSMASNASAKFLELYHNERQKPHGIIDALYHFAALETCRDLQISSLYRMRYRAQDGVESLTGPDHEAPLGRISIHLLEESNGKREADLYGLGAGNLAERFVGFRLSSSGEVEDERTADIAVDNIPGVDVQSGNVRLLRRVRKLVPSNEQVFRGCVIQNGLESKISEIHARLLFVEGTEDCFIRRPKGRLCCQQGSDVRERKRQARLDRMNVWLRKNSAEEKGTPLEVETGPPNPQPDALPNGANTSLETPMAAPEHAPLACPLSVVTPPSSAPKASPAVFGLTIVTEAPVAATVSATQSGLTSTLEPATDAAAT